MNHERSLKSLNPYLLNYQKKKKNLTLTQRLWTFSGLKFRTKDSEATRKTQNSGVYVVIEGGATYYDVLIDIIELNYFDKYRYVLFKCQ